MSPLNSDLDFTRNFFVFKTASQKNITAGETGFWHEKIEIPSGYKVLYVSATYNNADSCMLTSYDATIICIGNTSDIEPWFGFYATRTGTGTFTAYAVCVKNLIAIRPLNSEAFFVPVSYFRDKINKTYSRIEVYMETLVVIRLNVLVDDFDPSNGT